jgi:RNA polymerase sigma-70 factor (ECF subfamily)
MKRLLDITHRQRLPGAVRPPSQIVRPPTSPANPTHARHTAILEKALSDVFRLQHESLLRFLARRAVSRAEAEDIIQDAFVRILAIERTEEIRELERYVWRSALNIATDHGRARQRWNRMAKTIAAQEEPIAPSAEVVADARERWTLLTQAVSELPPREHQAFVLRIAQSLPFEEVGRAMHISSRMAKIYVARTLVSLQRRLEGGDAPRGVMTRRRSGAVAAPGRGGSVIQGRSARSGSRAIAKGGPDVTQAFEQRTQSRGSCPP